MVSSSYKIDTLEMGRGAFQALCDRNAVEVVRSGTTFAVSAYFPVLSFAFANRRSYLDLSTATISDLEGYQASQKRQHGSKVKLILPSVEASQLVSIDRAIGLGGGSHEIGHIICDMAGKNVNKDVVAKIHPLLKKFANDKYNLFDVLPTWTNICADIRLENMMSKLYPESKIRFHSIQEWVWTLEEKPRQSMGQNPAQALGVMIRDLGKNHNSKSQQKVFNEYATLYPRLWECALNAKNLWSQLQVDIKEYTHFKTQSALDKEIEKSVHLPLTIALELLMNLELPKKQPTPPMPQNNQDSNDDDLDSNNNFQESNDQESEDNQDGDDQESSNNDSSSNDSQDDDQDDEESNDDSNEDEDDQDDEESEDDDQDQDDSSDEESEDDSQDDDQDSNAGDSNDDDSQDGQDSNEDNAQDSNAQDSNASDEESKDDGQDDDLNQDYNSGESYGNDDDQDQDDHDSQDDQDSNAGDSQDNGEGSINNFNENNDLDLSQDVDINDIAKAFQKAFNQAYSQLDHRPYISNGLKIIDIV